MAEKNKIQTAMIVDDSEFDQVLYKELIERSGLVDKLIQYYYPDEALEFLKQPVNNSVLILQKLLLLCSQHHWTQEIRKKQKNMRW